VRFQNGFNGQKILKSDIENDRKKRRKFIMKIGKNEVDSLKERIKEIQDKCEHSWRVIKKPKLILSQVPGVFIGSKARSNTTPEITLICTKCSKRLVQSITTRCPKCLSFMRKGVLHSIEDDGTFSRKKYFGKEYLYYAIRLHYCTKCDFVIASDEWNQ